MKKILIVTGGTGGHLFPALALSQELQKNGCKVLFALRLNDSLSKTLSLRNLDSTGVRAAPFPGFRPAPLLRFLLLNLIGFFDGIRILRRFGPDAVLSFGAYVSAPVVLAAFILRKPVVLHEQNIVPGRANRFCALFAEKTAVSFPSTASYFGGNSLTTGNPVRPELVPREPRPARKALGLEPDRFTVLVFGGSAGARGINQGLRESLGTLSAHRDELQFVHLTGNREESARAQNRYAQTGLRAAVLDFSDDMSLCYGAADLVVARSGATTITELVVLKKPAILVPYPFATDDHQRKNAEVLQALGAALIVPESPDLACRLAEEFAAFLKTPERLRQMQGRYLYFPVDPAQAAGKLARLVLEAA